MIDAGRTDAGRAILIEGSWLEYDLAQYALRSYIGL